MQHANSFTNLKVSFCGVRKPTHNHIRDDIKYTRAALNTKLMLTSHLDKLAVTS